MNYKQMKLAFLCLSLLLPLTAFAQTEVQWITTASGVRARAGAEASAAEVTRLPIGTVLRQLDQEQRAATIGGKQDFWYHVALPQEKDGWVFGAFLKRFDAARKDAIYREIAATKAKAETGTFAEFSDLARFLSSVSAGITDRSAQAEVELWRWISVHRALENIPMEKLQQPEYQRFIKAMQPQITYSDPAGAWFIQADVLWNLQKKYADTPIAETIAWEAAQLPLPGECEGDLGCGLDYTLSTEGRYLQLYPNGKHSDAALTNLLEGFQDVKGAFEMDKGMGGTESPSAKAERRKLIAKLRATYARTTNPKKAKIDANLMKLEALYR